MDLHFSVIIPAYNAEAYIDETIKSVLWQNDVDFEIIVVDDGSTDNTLGIISNFGERVRIVRQKNSGPAEARNNGVREAKGNVIAFLDSDDIWLPDKLSAQKKKLNDGFDIVYTNRFNIGQIGDLPELQSNVVSMREGDLWEDLLSANMITTSSVVIVKELFERNGGFCNELPPCEDWDLWLRCSEEHLIGYCSEPLVKYRCHADGISRNYKLMSEMRSRVISNALTSKRGQTLAAIEKRKISAKTWSASGWDAAKAKDISKSLAYYSRALQMWPFMGSIWYDVARALAGRIGVV